MDTSPKIITFTLTMTLSKEEYTKVLQNSIERVMNTAIELGGAAENGETNEHLKELGSTSWQDCEELKSTNTKLWNEVRNAIFIELNQKKERVDWPIKPYNEGR